MRTLVPLTPPKDLPPQLWTLFRRLMDNDRELQAAIKLLSDGYTPDQRQSDTFPGPGGVSAQDHGSLNGLIAIADPNGVVTEYNDDHTQYAHLPGRADGQTLHGGRGSPTGTWGNAGTVLAHGSAISTFTGGSLVFDRGVPVGNVVVLVFSTYSNNNNYGGVSGVTTDHTSIIDSVGNTWTKQSEYTASLAGGLRENTLSVWTAPVTAAIVGGVTAITCAVAKTYDAGAITSRQFVLPSGASFAQVGTIQNTSTDAAVDYPAQTITDASGQTLFVRAIGVGTISASPPTFLASIGFLEADNDVDSTNVPTLSGARMEFSISSSLTATSNPAESVAQYHANTFIAFHLVGYGANLTLRSIDDADAGTIELDENKIRIRGEGDGSNRLVTIEDPAEVELSYIRASDGAFVGPVVLDPLEHLLNTNLFDDVLAGTVARGSLIVGNSTPKWAALPIGAAKRLLWSDGTDASWTGDPTIASSISVGPGSVGVSGNVAWWGVTSLYNALVQQTSGTTYPSISLTNITDGNSAFFQLGASDAVIGTGSALPLIIQTNNTTRIVISSAGLITTMPTMGVNLAMGGFDITGLDDVTLNADDASTIGTSTVGLREIHFALQPGVAGTLAATGRGIHWQDATEGTLFVGSDNLFPGFYSQRTVKVGSVVTGDNSEDATNLYQGNWGSGATPIWPFLEMNFQCGDGTVGTYPFGEDGATYIRNSAVTIGLYDTATTMGGGGLLLSARGGTFSNGGCGLYIHFDEANNQAVFRTMSLNSKAASSITKIAFAGTRLTAVIPQANNTIDLGIVSTNEWNDICYGGTLKSSIAGSAATFTDGGNILFGTTTGTKIGTATTQKLGFWNAAPIVQPAALTAQLTTITHTAPVTPDYAVQDLADSGVGSAFGFVTKDEGNTVLSVILNLQTRVQELENKLSAAAGGSGLIA